MQQNRERALALLGKMTVEEKVAQLVSAWLEIHEDGTLGVREYGKKKPHSGDVCKDVLGKGIGQLTRPYGTLANDPVKQARMINKVQRYLVEETRLGIPAMLHEECLTGSMIKGATIFPSALNYGSTWDPSLIKEVGKAIGDELRSAGVHQGLAPVLDVARDARWGRLEETFGEDPYLCGSMGIAYVKGLQGSKRSPLATLKHFVGHSFSEGARNHAPVHIGMRELYNTFALPFEMVVKNAQPGSLMPAYHDIDGVPCTGDRHLLTDLLKNKWGFDGLVVADYEAVVQLVDDHRTVNDMAEAAAAAFNAGMDIELPGFTVFKEGLIEALYRGLIDTADLNMAVLRVLEEKFRQGIFDHPYIDEGQVCLGSEKNHELAVTVAENSIVLLKNEGVLPFCGVSSVALIGPLADHPYAMYSGYAPPVHLQGTHGPEETVPKLAKTIRCALQEVLGEEKVIFEPGCMLYEDKVERAIFFPGDVDFEHDNTEHTLSEDTSRIDAAVAAALNCDATVLVVGDLAGLFGQGTVGEGSDASDLTLPGVQQHLLGRILETKKPVIVVLVSGRPYCLDSALAQAKAILCTWLPGEGGGEAIAQTLVGGNNPSGRLPLSFVTNAGAMPYSYNHSKKATGMPKQKDFGAVYPFGYGLSYSQFTWSDFSVEQRMIQSEGEFTVSLTVSNDSDREGQEVVQLYVRDKVASIVRPEKELKAFAKVLLKPQEKKRVCFTVPAQMLSFIGLDMSRILEPGTFDLMLGKSSSEILYSTEVTILGEPRELSRNWRSLSSVSIDSL